MTELSGDGSRLLCWTYLGGQGDDIIRSIKLRAGGVVYIVGSTSSEGFPATEGALQADCRGKGRIFLVRLRPA